MQTCADLMFSHGVLWVLVFFSVCLWLHNIIIFHYHSKMTGINKMDYTYMTEKSGQYTIIWTGFNTLMSSLHDLQSDQNLQDVTLVTDDNMHTKAQKLILASGSPILKILKN